MSLDTKYRPIVFDDVLGQEGTISVLKTLIQRGEIFQKSYVFSGRSGAGKTTTARILARAMLCDNLSSEGEPCNQCSSCKDILERGESHSFREMDAANNSGKDQIKRMLEELDYYTLDGKDRKIYLIDECHRLSTHAMDALLKPIEDNVPGSEDKKLVCLFCTTEPDKLSTTIKTRCMMFNIKDPPKEEVVDRLTYICEEEGINYDREALGLIFQNSNGHIREMINAVERISRSGDLTEGQVRDQLGLRSVSDFYRILIHAGDNLDRSFDLLSNVLSVLDPEKIYNGLAHAALSSYRTSRGITTGMGYTDESLAEDLNEKYGEDLLFIADRILKDDRPVDENILTFELLQIGRYLSEGTIYRPKNISTTRDPEPEPPAQVEEEEDEPSDPNTKDPSKDAADISELGPNFVRQNTEDPVQEKQVSKPEEVIKSPDDYDIKPLRGGQLRTIFEALDD